MTDNIEIIPPELAVKAMRDSGYRNTAYALTELIDNSAQAKASLIEVICVERSEQVNGRDRRRIKKLAVLDNGIGMTKDVLRKALQFGNGTHLDDRDGIGRFGMGLPNASISQCRRIEVWTWQNGPQNALYSYLDLDDIEARVMRSVPEPRHFPLPEEWKGRSKGVEEHGTLVLWSQFDEHRLTWKTGDGTLRNTEPLVGRMHRKSISDGNLNIRLLSFLNDTETYNVTVLPNDPLYLISPSSTPAPFGNNAMFQRWGEFDEEFLINWNGGVHKVIVRIAWARPETVPDDGTDRGATKYGKHAAKNTGVSIVRAGRELDLDPSWTNGYDPRERWWGVEVDFPPALDEVFGVTNNKQAATIFSHTAQFDWKMLAEPGEPYIEFKERMKVDGDPRGQLIDIAQHIHDQLKKVRECLHDQTKGVRGGKKRHDDVSVEDRASTKFKQRAEQGHKTDQDDKVFDEICQEKFRDDLVKEKNYPEQVASDIADAVKKRRRKVVFLEQETDSQAFFLIQNAPGGIAEVIFNRQHPAFEYLIRTLDREVDEDNPDIRDLTARISNASDTLKMLFAAWARYEMEDVPNRSRIKDMRHEWGKMARIFLLDEED